MSSRGRWLLALLSRIVPQRSRQDWVREWGAELQHAGGRFRARRALDAAEDAIRLRWHRPAAAGGGRGAWLHDVRYAARALVHRPAFVLAAGVPLALGIGANTAIFSVINGVLFHPLPYEEPDRLVLLTSDGTRRGLGLRAGLTPFDFLEWRETVESATGLAAIQNSSLGFTELDEPLVPLTHLVTSDFFDLLGAEAWLGRTFVPEDVDSGSVVIVSHSVWQQALESDPEAIGRTVVLDGAPYVVIGVMPPDFHVVHLLPVQPGLWVPTDFRARAQDRRGRNLAVFARLGPQAEVEQLHQELAALAEQAERLYPETHTGWGVSATPVAEFAVGAYRQTFGFVLLAVGLVLLIACANVANLSLAQAVERTREMALRAALGAGRLRLLRQTMLESLLLAALAGAAGVLASVWLLPLLVRLVPGADGSGSTTVGGAAAVPFLQHVSIDRTVLAFGVAVTLLTGLLAGIAPAVRGRQTNLASTLQEGGRNASTGRVGARMRDLLVVTETALALVLLVGAGLMMQSFRNLLASEIGYDAGKVLTLRNSLRIGRDPADWAAHFDEARRALAALPGVEAASAASFVPPEFPNANVSFHQAGEPSDPDTDPRVTVRIVMPDYFRTLGIDVLAGRPLTETDNGDAAAVLVVNQAFVDRYGAADRVVGQRLVPDLTGVAGSFAPLPGSEWEVVGVVGNIRAAGLNPTPMPMVYVPYAQAPIGIMNLLVRTREAPETLRRDAERAVWSLGRNMNIYSVEALDRRLGNLLWQPRFASQLLGLFSALALMLGAAGIYAVLSYSVSRRSQEMGVRVALGAERRDLLGMVIGSGLRLVAIGLVVGAAISYGVARLLTGLLYGVRAADPLTHLGVAAIIATVAVLACAIPAVRASRIDPIEALRAD